MPLNNPNLDLKRDLKDAAAALEHVDTLALMMLISGLYAGGDRLAEHAIEVRAGLIKRTKE